MRKVVLRASSKPPPRAREEMALMVGMGRAERVLRVRRRDVRKWVVLARGGVGGLAVGDEGGGNDWRGVRRGGEGCRVCSVAKAPKLGGGGGKKKKKTLPKSSPPAF